MYDFSKQPNAYTFIAFQYQTQVEHLPAKSAMALKETNKTAEMEVMTIVS